MNQAFVTFLSMDTVLQVGIFLCCLIIIALLWHLFVRITTNAFFRSYFQNKYRTVRGKKRR